MGRKQPIQLIIAENREKSHKLAIIQKFKKCYKILSKLQKIRQNCLQKTIVDWVLASKILIFENSLYNIWHICVIFFPFAFVHNMLHRLPRKKFAYVMNGQCKLVVAKRKHASSSLGTQSHQFFYSNSRQKFIKKFYLLPIWHSIQNQTLQLFRLSYSEGFTFVRLSSSCTQLS